MLSAFTPRGIQAASSREMHLMLPSDPAWTAAVRNRLVRALIRHQGEFPVLVKSRPLRHEAQVGLNHALVAESGLARYNTRTTTRHFGRKFQRSVVCGRRSFRNIVHKPCTRDEGLSEVL